MTISIPEENAAVRAMAAGQQPKPSRKARTRAPGARVAPDKGTTAKKGQSARKAPKSRKEKRTAPGGSKKAAVLALIQRPKGATLAELMHATGWQPHSVRGFLSGTLRKKMNLKVGSVKREDGERVYSIIP